MFRRILVPVDLSHTQPESAIVASAKQLLDAGDGGEITLLNVLAEMPPYVAIELPTGMHDKLISAAREELGKLAETYQLPPTTKIVVKYGNVVREIIDTAKAGDCDLIVIAAHQPGLADVFLGSTAGRVVRQAPCTVMVVR